MGGFSNSNKVAADENTNPPTVLTIAGFDPSGGAGIIADIRTLVRFGCRPTAAITSLTFQNSQGVFGAIHETAESLRAQVLPILKEFKVAGVKIGMLPTADLVREIVRLVRDEYLPSPVIDPVIQSSSGHRLMEDEAFEILARDLMPLARLITPNIPEAEKLAGVNIINEEDMRQAAARIRELGARSVLIKGGHLDQESGVRSQESRIEAIDVLDDAGVVTTLRGEWIDGPPVRGTGCMLSSAIAAGLAKRMSLVDSISAAKEFVAAEILNAKLKTEN